MTTLTLDNFVIQVFLLDPIEKIISQLKNKEFRDCDIDWLNKKLETFVELACQTLGEKVTLPSQISTEDYKILNNYLYKKYLNYFQILLDYFISF